ncbi:MAG: Mrr restriction system protein [Bacteroidaceae bacterium]|nr:Mrr restriction system protein [Bacteroidaceae bacterium]
MAKEQFGRSKACATKTLYAVMKEISRRGGSMSAKDLYPFVEANVELTDWEKEPAGKMKYIRWTNNFQFYSIDYQKAGFIIKKNGYWYITPEGEEALKKSPEEVMTIANKAYHEWKALNPKNDHNDEEPTDDAPSNDVAIKLEQLESNARDDIKTYIAAKDPYQFQEMVAALLRAMGYHTPFIAPKGKDGGIDIIAYVDPLGAQTPRIKVQVKHRPEASIGASDIRALLGILRTGDIALFVTSGSFSPDAKSTSTSSREFIRLIDGNDFIDMWQEYYDKMSDEDKNKLPLKRIAFLGSND